MEIDYDLEKPDKDDTYQVSEIHPGWTCKLTPLSKTVYVRTNHARQHPGADGGVDFLCVSVTTGNAEWFHHAMNVYYVQAYVKLGYAP